MTQEANLLEYDAMLKKADMAVGQKASEAVHGSQSPAATSAVRGVRFSVESEIPSLDALANDQKLPSAIATATDLPCPSTTAPTKPELESQRRGKAIRVGACFASSEVGEKEQSASQKERRPAMTKQTTKEKGLSKASACDMGTLSQIEISADGHVKVERRMIDFCTSFRNKTKRKDKDSGSKWGASRSVGLKTEGGNDLGNEVSTKKQPWLIEVAGHKAEGDGIETSSNMRPMGLQLQNVNGRYVVVASSVEVGGRNPADEKQYEEVHEDAAMTATSNSFSEREKTERWQTNETRLFYKSLQQCGTDFSMIEQLFPGRSRKQLKNKFKKEERLRPQLVSMALKSTVPLDSLEFEAVLGVPVPTDSTDLGRTAIKVDFGKQKTGADDVQENDRTIAPPN